MRGSVLPVDIKPNMLVKLFVRNYALIKDLNVEFEMSHYNYSETGAGKSYFLEHFPHTR